MSNSQISKILAKLLAVDTGNSSEIEGGYTLPLLQYVKKELSTANAKIKMHEYKVSGKNGLLGKRGNLLAILDIKKPIVLFQGHLDTVPNSPVFKPVIKNGLARGRGAVDMKGPIAGLIYAFTALAEKPKKLVYSPALLLTSDEEAFAFAGIRQALKNNFLPKDKIKLAICAEPSGFSLKNDLYGVMVYALKLIGTTAHSSLLKVDNPVVRAGKIMSGLEKSREILARQGTILNVTIIRAGEKTNQIPADCEIRFSIRNNLPMAQVEKILQTNVFSQLEKRDKIEKSAGFEPQQPRLSKETQNKLEKALGYNKVKPEYGTMKAFSEASFLNQAGIPAIVFGPGNIELAHQAPAKEKINVKSIEKFARILINLCQL